MSTRAVVLVGAGVVGAATAATSSVSLYRLAEQCAIGGWLAAALPIALDAGAAVGALAWITERGPARAWGRGIAVGSLVASLAGNGIQHALDYGMLRPTLPLVLAVGASIPASLWAVVHLSALLSGRVPKNVGGKRAQRTASTTIPPAAAPNQIAGRRYDHDQITAWLLARPVEGYSDEVAAIQARWGCSDTTAKRIRIAVRGSAAAS